KSQAWAISQPDSLAITFEVSPPDSMSGLLDLTAMTSGGIAPFGYAWSNGSTASFLENVPPGWYSLTVTDGNGCTATAQILAGETATGEASGGFSLRLFPTPTKRFLTVEIGSEISGEALLFVVDALGRVVFSETVELWKGLQVKRLSVESWAAGMYFLELRSEERRAGKKFLKVD
ncbi:MAG: T9SS type A sorting domain-containing protein, partial [Bacteroidota bacterium]